MLYFEYALELKKVRGSYDVLLLNGSRREKGCTYTALTEVAAALNSRGIGTEVIHAVPTEDTVASVAEKLKEADGLVIGSPVYWASPSGEMVLFLDKLSAAGGAYLKHKPAAAVASARRAGTTATLDVLLKYLEYHQTLIVSSNYWNMVHGNSPEEVKQDAEGLQIMHVLGANMAWLLKCLEAGRKAGIEAPETPPKVFTNFIR